jgi:tetratricopeptide (TPR) repeat protein
MWLRQLSYLLGRTRYQERLYEKAISAFDQVDRSSPHYQKAQFFSGMAYMQIRREVLAVKAFQRVAEAAEEGEGSEEQDRMKQLAWLSMARAYYSKALGHLGQACACEGGARGGISRIAEGGA